MCGSEMCRPIKAGSGRRRKLWELERQWHCSVVGTCLTMADLRRIIAKTRVSMEADVTDYHIHGFFVTRAGENGIHAKLMQKIMDQRFLVTINRFGRAKTEEELRSLWDEHEARGEVSGAYWALVTHPAAPLDLLEHVFGQVHMLSHLSGASHRGDLRRTVELEARVAELEQRLTQERAAARAEIARRDEDLGELRNNLAVASIQQGRVEALEARLAELEDGSALRKAENEAATLRRALSRAEGRIARAEARLVEREAELTALRETSRCYRDDVERMRCDKAAMMRELAEFARHQIPPAEQRPDLGGSCLLYVGGRDHLVPHMRAMAERCNGQFVHHDGGVESGVAALSGALERADAIFCPVDCVSHEAVNRIKRACERCSKPFIPLRSSGLSAFSQALRSLPKEARLER
ncbi:DUF2325 domain-containing protein [Telmatospirillum sp. J64-1]|uniref:DUF2325 domain-containing protein n=1 Tax=Telmatospirillum sp. J64-1 TaxID=2502183 RepID=UPI00115C4511|nr:DUF2325 domain-containing protein [Telmatospirillum sp. J64-1]